MAMVSTPSRFETISTGAMDGSSATMAARSGGLAWRRALKATSTERGVM